MKGFVRFFVDDTQRDLLSHLACANKDPDTCWTITNMPRNKKGKYELRLSCEVCKKYLDMVKEQSKNFFGKGLTMLEFFFANKVHELITTMEGVLK